MAAISVELKNINTNDMSCQFRYPTAKILVLGDSGVGKTSLIHLICHSTVLSSPQWTIGCALDVKLHENHFLEFWDVGGSRGHKIARTFLYQDYHGIMLVFDATNKKSRSNLDEWLAEVLMPKNQDSRTTTTYYKDTNVPILTLATKKDQMTTESTLDYFCNAETQLLYVNTQDTLSLDNSKLDSFFKCVIERKQNRFCR